MNINDLENKIKELEKENIALKAKMTLMYSNWAYDYQRFTDLKEKSVYHVTGEQNYINSKFLK
jgi:hypothetical protein